MLFFFIIVCVFLFIYLFLGGVLVKRIPVRGRPIVFGHSCTP